MMALAALQADAASVNSTIRITATSVPAEERAQAIGLDEEVQNLNPNLLPPTSANPEIFNMNSRVIEHRVRLTPGHPFQILFEGAMAEQWEYHHETMDVIVIRQNARFDRSYFELPYAMRILTIAISY